MEQNKIAEALHLQPLTEEEKKARHILGRLYGPIATCKESTRNGRFYNKKLWENALSDEVFKEKINNKSLFLELGHPADREETDMTKVCACIPEMPKIIGDDLYAYVDILDTPNGKLLKTLCDYGFVPGISSRGTGDVDDVTDEVDPNTFYLETWDIVQLPAVKKARLKMAESFDAKDAKLRTALQESYSKANAKDKEMMEESLKNLGMNMNINEDDESNYYSGEVLDVDDVMDKPIPDSAVETDPSDTLLTENNEPEAGAEPENAKPADGKEEGDKPAEPVETNDVEKKAPGETETDEAGKTIITGENDKPFVTVDDDRVVIKSTKFDLSDKESVSNLKAMMASLIKELTDRKLIEEPKTDAVYQDENPVDINDETKDVHDGQKTGKTDDNAEAGDAGDAKLLDSLKEALKKNKKLESDLKEAKKGQSAVGDAETSKLKENLEKYKMAFQRVSEIAAQAKDLKKTNESLSEELKNAKAELTEAKKESDGAKNLTESYKNDSESYKASAQKLMEQRNEARSDATRYKARLQEAINHYISNKADLLGVKPSDITGRLDESFTLDDIDRVCDDMLDNPYRRYSMNGEIMNKAKGVTINEAASKQAKNAYYSDPDNGYEIDQSLLDLAGLTEKDLK